MAQPFRIAIAPVPGFALMSYACTVEPLRAANLLSGRRIYDVVHVAAGGAVESSGAAGVGQSVRFGAEGPVDLALVVAGGDPFAVDDRALFDWLARLGRAGVRIGGVSGGPVILARAGLMAGRRMTVHWEHAAELSERVPDVLIEKRLYVMDRDRVTCGGGTAPLDLMHALIAEHHGPAVARLVSDWFLHTDVRAAAAPQRQGLAERVGARSPHLRAALMTMEDHVADPLSLSQLALMAGITPRHLNRLFREGLGRSAMEVYRDLRLDVANRLVTVSGLPIGSIAQATGFANAAHFSNAYARRFGRRPLADRKAAPPAGRA